MIDREQIRRAEERFRTRQPARAAMRERQAAGAAADDPGRVAARVARVATGEAFIRGGPTAAITGAAPPASAESGRVAFTQRDRALFSGSKQIRSR